MADFDAFCREMPAEVFKRWEAFFALEPWGHEQDWQRSGAVCASVFNSNPWRTKGARVFRVNDFVPRRRRTEDPKAKAQRERGDLAIAAIGGAVRLFSSDGLPLDPQAFLRGEY